MENGGKVIGMLCHMTIGLWYWSCECTCIELTDKALHHTVPVPTNIALEGSWYGTHSRPMAAVTCIVMPKFSSEPRFEPEPLGSNSKFSLRFRVLLNRTLGPVQGSASHKEVQT